MHRRPLITGLGLLALAASLSRADAGITQQELRFDSAGSTLAGTLHRPAKPVAAVVIVHGSGQERRMSELAARLARQGIAAFSYDKRGVGDSGGVYAGPEVGSNNIGADNLALLAADASAALTALSAALPAGLPLGLLGFSQAGWIIPLAAEMNPAARFMVLFSGPLATAREQLRFQFFTQGDPAFWEAHAEAEVREHIRTAPDRYDFPDTDPRRPLARLAVPGLWLFGGQDVQIPVGLSIERLDELRARGRPYEHQRFPALGHGLVASDAAVEAAVRWIQAASSCSSRCSRSP